jgi:hypothetical protein
MPSIVQWEPRTQYPEEQGEKHGEMQDGLQARLHDPVWLLARQWQFGEFTGDDAGSPAAAHVVMEHAPISRYLPGPLPANLAHAKTNALDYSPMTLPLEALVEREPISRGDRRNFRLSAEAGLHFLRLLDAQGLESQAKIACRTIFLTAYGLQSPTEEERRNIDGESFRFLNIMATRVLDGAKLYAKLAPLRQNRRLEALFEEAPTTGIPANVRARVVQAMATWLDWSDGLFSHADQQTSWVKERLEYAFAVSGKMSGGEVSLCVPEYLEGRLDWFSFVVNPSVSLGAAHEVRSQTSVFLPTPVTFRGMPASRLWEFEDASVNFAKVDANPHDLARLLLVEFALVYGNDWFVVPVEIPVGSLCRVASLIVTNTFGERMLIPHTTKVDGAASPWRMFCLSRDPRLANSTEGDTVDLASQDLFFLPPILGIGLESAPVEEVLFLRDEMANMAWAVERVVESQTGRPLDRFEMFQETRRRQEQATPNSQSQTTTSLTYRLGTSVPDYWVPLLPVQDGSSIRLKRGALPRMQEGTTEGILEPQGIILDPGHELFLQDEEVPREGARVTRSYQYSRWVDGSTHVWVGRRKRPGRGEGSSGLRFDIVEPT